MSVEGTAQLAIDGKLVQVVYRSRVQQIVRTARARQSVLNSTLLVAIIPHHAATPNSLTLPIDICSRRVTGGRLIRRKPCWVCSGTRICFTYEAQAHSASWLRQLQLGCMKHIYELALRGLHWQIQKPVSSTIADSHTSVS